MSESRDHICPRCGSYLPTVAVRVPVYVDQTYIGEDKPHLENIIARYDEREEVAECVRCTGSY